MQNWKMHDSLMSFCLCCQYEHSVFLSGTDQLILDFAEVGALGSVPEGTMDLHHEDNCM